MRGKFPARRVRSSKSPKLSRWPSSHSDMSLCYSHEFLLEAQHTAPGTQGGASSFATAFGVVVPVVERRRREILLETDI
jgi:hypothetical protein